MACIYKNEGFLPLAIYITTSLSVFLFSLSLHVVLLRIKHMTYFLYKIFLFFPLSLLFLLFCFSFLVIFTWLWYTIMFMQNLEQAMIWIWRRRCKIRALAQLHTTPLFHSLTLWRGLSKIRALARLVERV